MTDADRRRDSKVGRCLAQKDLACLIFELGNGPRSGRRPLYAESDMCRRVIHINCPPPPHQAVYHIGPADRGV